jgi:uncharacterized protein (TIGR03790 family)
MRARIVISLAVAILSWSSGAAAQTSENILLVINRASKTSEEIGSYYATKRAIPAAQILRLDLPVAEQIDRTVFTRQIELPLVSWFAERNAHDRILYIVIAKDVPLRIAGTTGPSGTVSSVDSELTLLYRKMMGIAIPPAGPVTNPYFLQDKTVTSLKPFTHRTHDIYLVTRLDGFTAADVKRLIDRGSAPIRQPGRILLGARRDGGGNEGNKWLERAAARLQEQRGWADHALLTNAFRLPADKPLLGYYSWGSNDTMRTAMFNEPRYSFLPGAVAAMFVSTDARTFKSPPPGWRPGQSFGGSAQSLIGTFIRDGVTGAAGHVAEPYLTTTIRPDILFPAYARGLNLAEAFYAAMPTLGWQTIVIGDPLCAPFRTDAIAKGDLDPGVDAVTGLPTFFSDRRVRLVTVLGTSREAARYFLRANLQSEKKDTAGAIAALEASTKADPRFATGHLTLATLLEASGRYDAAVERYREVLKLAPDNVSALNNLAYLLSVRRKSPKEALPIAKRAYAKSKSAPVADTLGWIQHLLGNDKDAEPLLLSAVKMAPNHPEILLHTAVVLAANGKRTEASQLLMRAEKASPALARSDDARRLRERLDKPSGTPR